MIELRLLGRALVERDGSLVRGRAVQNHHLALLAFLAVAPGRTASRDRLIALLWPESETGPARHRLSVALHAIRRGLGTDAILTTGDAVVLNLAVVRTDVGAFLDAVEAGRLREAVEVCRGPFLDGFYLKDGLDFERWADRERERLAGLCRSALEQLASEAETEGRHGDAMAWRRRITTRAPYESSAALALMETMVAGGDVAAAIDHARSYITRVEAELGIPANPRVLERTEQLAQEAKKRGLVRLEPGPTDSRNAAQGTEAPPLGPAGSARSRGGLPTLAAGVLVALSAVWAIAASIVNPARGGAPSVVVLPFAGVDPSPADAPLGEALAENVAATLSIVPNLEVRDLPETSRSGERDPRRVARAAGATYVVTGTVHRRGTRAEARTHLVHAATGDVRWEGTHTRELRSTEALVEALSMAVADDLRTRVAPYVPHRYTDSESAFDAFLSAVYEHRKFNEESIWVALQHYRRGWEEDPGFALAHAIAGTAYMTLSQNFGLTGQIGWEHGRQHVMRALELDPTLPEAYSVLGRLQLWWDRDFESTEATLRRAIMLYPTHPDARTWYGFYQLYYLRDFEGAVASMRRSLEVDPLNTARSRDVETALYHARRFEEVAAQRRHTESLDAGVAAAVANYRVADAYREMGRYDQAIAEYRAVHVRRGGATPVGLGVTYARMGRLAEARAVLREREARLGPQGPSGPGTAQLYANLGELDRAFDVLEQVLEKNSTLPLSFTTNPAFDPLRSDPRFDDILRRMGLPVP